MRWMVNYKNGKGPCRVNQSSAVVDDFIYSFGGFCQQISAHELKRHSPIDVHVLNTLTFKWNKRPLPKKEDPQYSLTPYFRYGHTCVSYQGFIYLWGGRTDWTNNLCNTLYRYDPKNHIWSIVIDSGDKPDGRDGHTATVVRDSMYIFGGFVQKIKRFNNDVYEFNFPTSAWTLIVPKTQLRPFWRDFHTATAIGDCIYVFGGRMDVGRARFTGENFYANDLYAFDTASKKWIELRPDTSGQMTGGGLLERLTREIDIQNKFSPCGRRSHSAVAFNNRLIVFGGFQEKIQKHFNDMYEYNPERNEWRVIAQEGNVPSPRRRHSCHVINSQMVIFGGTGPNEELTSRNSATGGENLEASTLVYYQRLLDILNNTMNRIQNVPPGERGIHLAEIFPPIQQLLEFNRNRLQPQHLPSNNNNQQEENGHRENNQGAVGLELPVLEENRQLGWQDPELLRMEVEEELEFDDSDEEDIVNDEQDDDIETDEIGVNELEPDLLSFSDLHIFELSVPSLKILSELCIISNKIDCRDLPQDLKDEIECLKS